MSFLVLIVVLVTLFGTLHPVLSTAGLCGSGECQEFMEHSFGGHTGFSISFVAIVASASGIAAFAFASISLRRRLAKHSRPHELYLAPDPPPPQLFPNH